jgi:hypothetical protein
MACAKSALDMDVARAASRFFPDASRTEAEAMLKDSRAGSFVVRKSSFSASPPIVPTPVWYAFVQKKRDGNFWNALIQHSASFYKFSFAETGSKGSSRPAVHRFEYKSLAELIMALLTDQELISLAKVPDRLVLPC